jgi:autotransporter-associated beta strand protein
MMFDLLCFSRKLVHILVVMFVLAAYAATAQSFIHPGCLSTTNDFTRMVAKVQIGAHPWIDSWNILINNSSAQTTYSPNPQTQIVRGGAGTQTYQYAYQDAAAAYQLSLRWRITGDNSYANTATNILNQWANTCTNVTGDSNYALAGGLYGYEFACAAETLRGYSGWNASDFAKFQSFMTNVFYAANNGFLVNHNGTCSTHYFANWDLCNMASMLAIGVLCDRRDIYNQAITYYTNGIGAGAAKQVLVFTHPGYLGECQESGRDQGHCTLDPILLSVFCEIAWNQGDDMYGYGTNTLLQLGEYVSKYNVLPLGPDVPYVAYLNCEYYNHTTEGAGMFPSLASGSRGTGRPGWSLIYNHYTNRRGLSAPWTGLMASEMNVEGGGGNYGSTSGGYDQLGFTTLTHTRDPIAPASVPAPSKLLAQPRNNTVTLSWFGSAGAASYNIKRGTSLAGPYTNIASVLMPASAYLDMGLIPGTNYFYEVSAMVNGVETTNSLPLSATPNLQLTGVVIGSTNSYQSAGADKTCLFDGSLNNYYDAFNASGDWGGLDLGRSNVITQIAYCPRPGLTSRMVGGQFQGCNSNTNFSSGVVTLFTIGSAPADTTPPTLTYQTISNTNAFRYVRYLGPANASCNAAEIQFFGAPPAPAPPAAPLGLVADAGNQQTVLTWSEADTATSYNIKRSTNSGGPYTVIATNVLTTTFTDTGLLNYTNYFYVVSAVNGAGEGSNSVEVSTAPSPAFRAGSIYWMAATNTAWDVASPNWATNLQTTVFQNGNAVLFDDAASLGTVTISSSVSPSSVIFNNFLKSYTLSGSPITGSCILTLLGDNSVQLGSANTFTGGVILDAGTVIVGNANAFGTGPITLAGGTIQWGATGYTITNAMVAQAGTSSTLAEAGGAATTFSGNITGSGAIYANASVNFGGAQLSGNNSGYAGTLTVNNSSSQRFRFLSATAGSSNAVWVLNNNTSDGQSANFGNGTLYFGALSGNGQFRQDTAGTSTLEIGALNLDTTFSGIIYQANSGDIFAVNKVGSGTQTFAGANNYSGLTVVKSGRLLLNQNQTGAGGFTVSNSATLGITNSVPSNMADLGALTLSAGSTLEFQNISNLTSALIDTTSFTASGTCKVLITGTNYLVIGSTYPLLTNSGTMSGFGNLSVQMPPGYGGVLVSNANQISITVTVPPVPSIPPNLVAVAGDANVSLSWNAATNATGYNLKRSLTNGGPYAVILTNYVAMAYTNSGLLNGTNYFYVVSSTNISGESANSAQVAARPTSLTPANVAFNVGGGQLQLNWPADHTGWRLQSQTNASGVGLSTNWTTVPASTNASQYSVPIASTNGNVFFRLVYP